ncbi:MAG: amidohydrolase, partial [Planctomycetota bacterium]
MKLYCAYFSLLLMVAAAASVPASDPIPGTAQQRPVALVGGTIYPVSGDPIPGGTLVFAGGKIVALGKQVNIPAAALHVDIRGRRVYPSFIACDSQIGLVEIGAVRATRDGSEVGEINPNVRAEVSVNPDSEHIPVARANGVALVESMPTGGLISGSSALLRLDGWTWEDLLVEAPLGIHVHWPRMRVEVPEDDKKSTEARKKRDQQLAAIHEAFAGARAYAKAKSARNAPRSLSVDLRYEALLPVISRERPVFLHAGSQRQIRAAVEWARGEKLRPVIVGGQAAPAMADYLKSNEVAVIYGPVHRLPMRRDMPYDAPFTGPARLHEAGVTFALTSFETSNVRNLPYHAAMAAAYGLAPEEA